MRFVLSRRLEELPINRAQWNALLADAAQPTIFQTYEWFECWWAAFGLGKELYVVTISDGESLVGIAPLMIVRRHGLRRLKFVGSPNADYQDFILGKRAVELLPALIRYLFDHRDEWDTIVLRNVPTHSPTFAALPAMMRSLGLGATDLERIPCPTFVVASRAAEVHHWLDRYSLRRRIKQLRRLGEVTFVRCDTPEQLNRFLPQFFEQYVQRRRGTAAADAFMRPDVREFFDGLARSILPSGWLHFSVLQCAGQPVAFHFGFEFGDRLYWYKPCFDPQFARQSPGKILLSYLIRDALARQLKELDFTVGAEAFKARYTSVVRTNANLRVFRRRWLFLVTIGLIRTRRTLGRWRSCAIKATANPTP